MIITNIVFEKIQLSLTEVISTRTMCSDKLDCLQVKLITNNQVYGLGHIYNLSWNASVCIKYIEQLFKPLLLGNDPLDISMCHKMLYEKILTTTTNIDQKLAMYALSVLDIALWDLKAKANNQALIDLLGKARQQVPVYGSGGWLGQSDEALLAECRWYMDRGVILYKIRVGSANDEQRLKLLRKTFGQKLQIAVDANQSLSFSQAVAMTKMLEQYNISWLEEPLHDDCIDYYIQLNQLSKIPIALGENIFSLDKFSTYCCKEVCAIMQPDIGRCGGITNFLVIAELCQQKNIELMTHLMTPLSVSVMGHVAQGYVEHIKALALKDFAIHDGKILLSDKLGHGVDFSLSNS